MGQDISKFYRSFSGTDSLAFMLLPNSAPILMGSLTTISYSMSRDKKPVPLIGRINIGGFTRGTRIYAGTMIFTLINQHWINDLLEQVPWLSKYGKIKADELPLFDIMIISANEYGASVRMFIYGIDVTDEGQVLSVEDLFTENQFSFVARDIDTFANDAVPRTEYSGSNTISSMTDFNLDSNQSLNTTDSITNFESTDIPLDRNLSYDSSNTMTGDDVLHVQQMLNAAGQNVPLNGTYDLTTYEAVKQYQSSQGLEITGSITDETYHALNGDSSDDDIIPTGVVISKPGALVYTDPDTSSAISSQLNYKDTINIIGETANWYQIDNGYVPKSHIFSSTNKADIDYPTLRPGDSGNSVVILQNSLNTVLGTNIPITGTVDDETVNAIKQFESDMGLPIDGIFDKNDWIVLQDKVDGIILGVSTNSATMSYLSNPKKATYQLASFNDSVEGIRLSNIVNDSTIKVSAVAYYSAEECKTFTSLQTIKAGQSDTDITPAIVQDAFLYNGNYKKTPMQVDFIILVYGQEPMKWTYYFK